MRHAAFDPEREWYDAAVGAWFRCPECVREQPGSR